MLYLFLFILLGQLAFCGEILELEFTLPFKQFLPKVEEIRFFIRSEMLILRSFLPDSNTLRRSVVSLARNSDSKLYPSTSRLSSLVSDTPTEQQDQNEESNYETDRGEKDNRADPNDLSKGWRRKTGSGFGWIDVWSVPFLALNLFYKYHPIHVTNEFITSINKRLGSDVSKVDPSLLEPDLLTVELEAGPSSVRLLGSFFRQFIIGLKVCIY